MGACIFGRMSAWVGGCVWLHMAAWVHACMGAYGSMRVHIGAYWFMRTWMMATARARVNMCLCGCTWVHTHLGDGCRLGTCACGCICTWMMAAARAHVHMGADNSVIFRCQQGPRNYRTQSPTSHFICAKRAGAAQRPLSGISI